MAPPELLWSQRSSETEASKNVVFITLNVPELNEDYKLTVEGSHLSFLGGTHPPAASGTASKVDAKTYELELDLFAEAEEIKRSLNGKSLSLVLKKKELGEDYWPRLTKDKVKLNYVKTDFSKWKDQDEQDEVEEDEPEAPQGPPGGGMPGMGGAGGGMDFASMMQGMGGGGAGGAGGMDMEALMKMMGQQGGAGGLGGDFGAGGEDEAEEDDEEDGPPELEETA